MPLPLADNGKVIIIGYIPTLWASCLGIAVFALLGVAFLWNFFRYGRQRYLLWVTVGAFAMALGFIVRIPYANNPTSIPIYSISTMLTLLAPCAFIAQDYYVLPKLAEWLEADDCLFLKPRLVGRIFLISDVITFLVQLGGSGMTAVQSLAHIGDKASLRIVIVGLVAQLASFSIFMFLLVWFGYKVKTHHPRKWLAQSGAGWRGDWRAVYWATLWTCLGIVIRCVYRTIEFAQGYDGVLRTTEWYFYVLDSLPLVLAIAIWVPIWPSRYLMAKLGGVSYPMAGYMQAESPMSV